MTLRFCNGHYSSGHDFYDLDFAETGHFIAYEIFTFYVYGLVASNVLCRKNAMFFFQERKRARSIEPIQA